MEKTAVFRDIAARTGGEVYIGVVGPVRTGKSTFIRRVMETMVVPHMAQSPARQRAMDELPQAAAGKTIMTTEPKFIPEEAAVVQLDDAVQLRMRLIDCVGYIVPSALGHMEGEYQRMVSAPWFSEPVPFEQAAETGTRKVIADHSTIGIVVTTDGSVSDISRADYEAAEQRVVRELTELGKPFVVLLNCLNPDADRSVALARELSGRYEVPVLPVNCELLGEREITAILAMVTREFPAQQLLVDMPRWVTSLPAEHWLRRSVFEAVFSYAKQVRRVRDAAAKAEQLCGCEHIAAAKMERADLGSGIVSVTVSFLPQLFYKVLSQQTGLEIADEGSLLPCITELAAVKKKYEKVAAALAQVEATGYGIVMPSIDELQLEEPQIMHQGGRYGVKLRASAPSIHMLRADITTEVNPIVGSEKQSEELVMYLMREFEEEPGQIWDSNIFGKSLSELVNEGLQNKLYRMPDEARAKLQETLERIINEGCSGLICFIL